MKKFYNKRSFTLIELVLTMVIIGIVSIPISLLISEQFESYLVSQDHSIALNLARLEMEKINNLDYANITVGTTIIPNYENYDYDLARIVTYAYGSGGSNESLKEVKVLVARTGTTDILVTLITFFAKNVSYGV